MLVNMIQQQGSKQERKLCKLYKTLNKADQHSLMSFAEFLAKRNQDLEDTQQAILATPLDIPRPENESVIKAVRRLKETYPMLNTDGMFDNISALMTSHIMEARPAESVIDELEALFAQYYEDFCNG